MKKKLTRYDVIDAYTLEEVRREYEASDAKGRIDLLRRVYRTTKPSAPAYEVALLAVEDPNPYVRAWIARNGYCLDYGEGRFVDNEWIEKHPERNLEERLLNDPDPFVRASLFENETIIAWPHREFERWFWRASRVERLALVRNRSAYGEFIEQIFDSEDGELAINTEERKELALAYLTNKKLEKENEFQRRKAGSVDEHEYVSALYDERHLSRLWELASKWPTKSTLPHAVYTCVCAPDTTRAKIYQLCNDEPFLRRTILHGCDHRDRETLKLGMEDSDEDCRDIAERVVKEGMPKTPEAQEELFQEEEPFRAGVRNELQSVSRALDSLRRRVIAIGAGVLFLVVNYLFPRFLR